ncbi:MAG: PilZ domain-containing protein [Deltaproteobacteria bacterium]|nr:PilZ domain-containing protein [Deltaproteobacteria bacterium]
MTETNTERRNEARVTVDLWVEEHSDDALYFQRATNLSTGGVFLERTLPHAAGTRIEIDLRLPGDAVPLRVTGEVIPVEAREVGMSVRFVSLSDPARDRIAQYLRTAPFRVHAKA